MKQQRLSIFLALLAGCSVAGRPAMTPSPIAYEPEPQAPAAEEYAAIQENAFRDPAKHPLSTFAIDVDTASYSNVRRFLKDGSAPPVDAVRIEELINYFEYAYPQPDDGTPFSITTEVASAPWAPEHALVRIGLKGKEIADGKMPARNLVFLIDVSGSMGEERKLPLLVKSLEMLTETLGAKDRVAIVVYAGASGVVLPPTRGSAHGTIVGALSRLSAGGSTNGGAGIEAAYALAEESFDPQGVNRVILATDGDFNVGVTSRSSLVELIEAKREKGVFLTVLGFGYGNYKDATMEALADKGNGNYAYVDSIEEARKVLVDQGGSTLVTIAKDTKVQVEVDASRVASYRLIGYENRLMKAADFADDRKDGGELGAGHTVTALYELVLKDGVQAKRGGELMQVRLRYKDPQGSTSKLISRTVVDRASSYAQASVDFRFAAAVAGFGMVLRGSPYAGSFGLDQVASLAEGALGADERGYRREMLGLISLAKSPSSRWQAKRAASVASEGGQDGLAPPLTRQGSAR